MKRAAHPFLQGRAAAARRSQAHHNQEAAGANPAPVTRISREGGQARLARPPAPEGDGTTVGAMPTARMFPAAERAPP